MSRLIVSEIGALCVEIDEVEWMPTRAPSISLMLYLFAKQGKLAEFDRHILSNYYYVQ